MPGSHSSASLAHEAQSRPDKGSARAPGADTTDVAVVGLGYVGLVLAASVARTGRRVVGAERNPDVLAAIRDRRAPFYEPGLDELLQGLPAGALEARPDLDGVRAGTLVLCVGTPFDHATGTPDLADLRAALDIAFPAIGPDTLVIVRSTVPVGTCRTTVLPRLTEVTASPMLAFCPERTIQGRALAEIAGLPQVIGGLDEMSSRRASEFFSGVAPETVAVSSLEAAELVKLVCNAHTDVLYGFGNEVAFIADVLGLSGREVIEAAGRGYPRPAIAQPGYVGGSCLVKDPYLLAASSADAGYRPSLVPAARAVNERLPRHVADQVTAWLDEHAIPAAQAKVLVCGIAYKGRPETDDTRGAASTLVAQALSSRVGTLAGHDPLLGAAAVTAAGFQAAGVADGLEGAHALILLTDHAAYCDFAWRGPLALTARPALVVDVWCLLPDEAAQCPWIDYRGFGYA